MSAKPTALPEWASSPPAGAIVEPSAGQKQSGWAPGQIPPSQYWNWLAELTWLWCEYLSDLDLDGPMRLATGANAVRLEVNAADQLDLRNNGDTAGAALTCGPITVDDGSNVEVSGDGRYMHGPITLRIAALAGRGPFITSNADGTVEMASASSILYVDCPVFLGKTLTAARVRLTDDATDVMDVDIGTIGDSGFVASGGGWSGTSAGSGATQTVAVDGGSLDLTAALVMRIVSATGVSKQAIWIEFDIEDNGI